MPEGLVIEELRWALDRVCVVRELIALALRLPSGSLEPLVPVGIAQESLPCAQGILCRLGDAVGACDPALGHPVTALGHALSTTVEQLVEISGDLARHEQLQAAQFAMDRDICVLQELIRKQQRLAAGRVQQQRAGDGPGCVVLIRSRASVIERAEKR